MGVGVQQAPFVALVLRIVGGMAMGKFNISFLSEK